MSWSECLDFDFGYNKPQHWVRSKEKQIKGCTTIYCCYSYATGASLGVLGENNRESQVACEGEQWNFFRFPPERARPSQAPFAARTIEKELISYFIKFQHSVLGTQ